MKRVNNKLCRNTYTVKLKETNFDKHIQDWFLILFQKDNFSVMQGVVLASQRLAILEESSHCRPVLRSEWGFLLNIASAVVKRCCWKRGINGRSKDSVYIELIIFPKEFNIVKLRHLTAFVSKSCAPTLLSTSSLFYCVPCWLEVTRPRARWLFKNYWL